MHWLLRNAWWFLPGCPLPPEAHKINPLPSVDLYRSKSGYRIYAIPVRAVWTVARVAEVRQTPRYVSGCEYSSTDLLLAHRGLASGIGWFFNQWRSVSQWDAIENGMAVRYGKMEDIEIDGLMTHIHLVHQLGKPIVDPPKRGDLIEIEGHIVEVWEKSPSGIRLLARGADGFETRQCPWILPTKMVYQ